MRLGPVLVPSEPGDDAVGRSLMLDLEHRPLARQVATVEPLGDDPVEPGALERAVLRDDDLTVEDAPVRQGGPERGSQLREVAIQWLEVAGLRVDLVAVTEDQRPEAVPFRLEEPAFVSRQPFNRLCEHRLEWR